MATTEAPPGLPFEIAPTLPRIRPYRDEDAAALAAFWRAAHVVWPGGGPGGALWATPEGVRRDTARVDYRGVDLYWADDPAAGEPRVVGFCSHLDLPDPRVLYVGVLAAHPGHLRTGIGRDLLKRAVARAVALGRDRVELHTWTGNERAVPLYKKIGFYWEPGTAVHMVNFLPLIFRQPIAQRFFARADWYRDARRDLSLVPDETTWRGHEVYEYRWERGGRCLRVVVDRHSGGLVLIEDDALTVEAHAEGGRLPVGEAREAVVRVERRGGPRRSVAVVAAGHDGLAGSARAVGEVVDGPVEWRTQLRGAKAGRGRLEATVLVDGEAIELAPSVEVVEPVTARVETAPRLAPGMAATAWVTLSNELDRPARGKLRLAAEVGLAIEPGEVELDLMARGSRSWRLRLRAERAGSFRIEGWARLDGASDDGRAESAHPNPSPRSKAEVALGHPLPEGEAAAARVLAATVHCGGPGALFVEESGDDVAVVTDGLRIAFGAHPRAPHAVVRVMDRERPDELVAVLSSRVGPPCWPPFRGATWARRVEHGEGGVTVTLSSVHGGLAGVTVERIVRVAPTGVVELRHRVVNAGDRGVAMETITGTTTGPSYSPDGQVAAPLAAGLVLEDGSGFPDWGQPDASRPERFAEGWLARQADGRVVATVWSGSREVAAHRELPSLASDLGTIAPGESAETPPIYLYVGPGDWRTARALWRQLVAPEAPAEDPIPRPATRARLVDLLAIGDELATEVTVESERARPLSGRVAVEVAGREVAAGAVEGVRFDAPARVPVAVAVPAVVGARSARVVFDDERSREAFETALIRAGRAGLDVRVDEAGERVVVDNGLVRLGLLPRQLGRVVELAVDGHAAGQLLAAPGEPVAFGGRYPWFGGIHPTVMAGDAADYPGRLPGAVFAARAVERVGARLAWRGVAASVAEPAAGLEGLALEVAYLTLPGSNLLAAELRLENRRDSFFAGQLGLETFLAPGGSHEGTTLWLDRGGQVVDRKRLHPGDTYGSARWCAVEAAAGSPVVALVAGTPNARVMARDLGFDGAHPRAEAPARLAPGGTVTMRVYLVVAEDAAQARLYRHLAELEGLP